MWLQGTGVQTFLVETGKDIFLMPQVLVVELVMGLVVVEVVVSVQQVLVGLEGLVVRLLSNTINKHIVCVIF
jgi:hypothetical protein